MNDKAVKVLFVCVHNSARSQMAEAYLNKFGEGKFIAESAGIEPGKLNPLVVKAMADDGIDISTNSTNSVFDYFKESRLYRYVITVCEKEAAERCPIFPGVAEKIQWSFKDPSKFEGTDEAKLEKVKEVRDEIKKAVQEWVEKISK